MREKYWTDPVFRARAIERSKAQRSKPGYREADSARRSKRYYENREAECEAQLERYYNLSGYEYNRLALYKRRASALKRMAEREARGRELRSG